MKVYIPFKETFKEDMLLGSKVCTSRNRKYGSAGDTFFKWSETFTITEVKEMTLDEVSKKLYRQEGFFSPTDFISCWVELHPRKGWVSNQVVFVHFFKRVK